MEVLVLDGKNYVKASKAARELGYAPDYVGQLCRGGHVDAHLIGRTWYVNQDELSTHRVEKKRMSRIKAREHAKRSIEEHRLKVTGTRNNYKNIDIRYETDTEELIPEVRKVVISSEHEGHSVREPLEIKADIENEGEKVLMKGDVPVVDLSEEATVDTETVVLTPSRPKTPLTRVSKKDIEKIRPNFADRLAVSESTEGVKEQESTKYTPKTVPKALQKAPSLVLCSVVLFCVLIAAVATISVTSVLEYSGGEYSSSYMFGIDETISKIQRKI